MADFSYESDIAPMRGGYFSGSNMSNLSTREQDYLRSRYGEKSSALLESQIKTANEMVKLRGQEISFQQQQMELQRASDAARMEREALTAIPDVTKKLTSVLEDPSLDDATKTAKVAELKLQNVGLATNSKTINNLFTAAEGTIQSRKSENDRTNALAYALTQTGQADAVKKLFEGKQNPMAQEYILAAEAIGKANEAQSKSKMELGLEKELQKQEAAMQTARISLLNRNLDTLSKIAPPTEEMKMGSINTGTTAPIQKPFELKPQDKIELQAMARFYRPEATAQEVLSLSDEDLYRSTLDFTTSTLRNMTGFSSGSRVPKNKFSVTPVPPTE